MQGLELSRCYFEEFGRPMLETRFPDLLPYMAVGLFGSGSECFGYDDPISRDHDFGPGFCIFLPGEELVDRRSAFLLERAYARLPKEYRGFRRELLAPVGGARKGVLRTGEFFQNLVGSPDGELTVEQWLSVPEQSVAEATNGEVFFDRFGEVSGIREKLAYYPEDIRLKRLAGILLLMAQSGQYNYGRCLAHGEPAAAQLAVFAFAESMMSAAFLLERRYQPYYKWRFRAFRELPIFGSLSGALEELVSTPNDELTVGKKQAAIDALSATVVGELAKLSIPEQGQDLEPYAYAVNDRIKDPVLRNMHILAAV